ncbi:MAG: translocation/assembly module TamB domain-containing protein, partial [Bacteroidota bacterium]|nr:translocation/assembly module TamB domain-containing protein [Bacteroidota bacterium]
MGNNPKKITMKYGKFILMGVVLLFSFIIITSIFVLKTDYGKKYSANLVEKFLEKKLLVKVEIKSLTIKLSSAEFDSVLIYDSKNNLLANVRRVEIKYFGFRRGNNRLKFKKLLVEDAEVFAQKYQGRKGFNFQYLIWRVKNKDPNHVPKTIVFNEFELRNVTLHYKKPDRHKNKGLVNWDNFTMNNLNVKFKNFKSYNRKLNADIVSASGLEENGLELNNIQANLYVDSTRLELYNLKVHLNSSEIRGDLKFYYKTYRDFKKVNTNVILDADFENTKLYLDDLKYFQKEIKSNEKFVVINGSINGKIEDLKSDAIEIQFGKNSDYKGQFRFKGLPEISETFIDVKLENSKVTFKDLNSLLPKLKIPEYFSQSKQITFNGRFTGFVNDFVAYGNIYTPYGKVKTDINFKIPFKTGIPSYSGKINLVNFDLGEFSTKKSKLGAVNMVASIEGKGVTVENLKANIKADADYLEFNNYFYKNVQFNGYMEQKIFQGLLKIDDRNINLDFDGKIDISQLKPEYKFTADFKKVNLHKLHFANDSLLLNGIVEINLKANNIDDIEGTVLLLNSDLKTRDENYNLKTALLSSTIENGTKKIELKSELIDATFEGKFNIKDIPYLAKQSISKYVDSSFISSNQKVDSSRYLEFDINLHHTSFLNRLLGSKVIFEDRSKVKGVFDKQRNIVKLNATIPGIYYKDFYIKNLIINTANKYKTLVLYSSLSKVFKNDSLLARDINLSAESLHDSINLNLYLYSPKLDNHITLIGDMSLKKDSVIVNLENSEMMIANNEKWLIESDDIIIKPKGEVFIQYLQMNQGESNIKILGTISEQDSDPLRIVLNNLDFNQINKYIPVDLSSFSGALNGQLVLFNVLKNPYFDAAIWFNPIIYNQSDSLGVLTLYSNYNNATARTVINGNLKNFEMEDVFNISGSIDLVKTNNIDLTLDIPSTESSNFEPFLKKIVSDVRGEVSANIKIYGPIEDYKILGKIDVENTAFTVNYLKTRYSFSDNIYIDQKGIYLRDILLLDDKGNKAKLIGKVKHNSFKDFMLDISILASDFHAINTTAKDNNMYYGNAFVSGRVDFKGPPEKLKLDIQLKSEKDSKIYLKAYDNNTFGNYDFIKFTDEFNTNQHSFETVNSKKKISLNLDLELNTNADIELIFNPVTRDLIKATGKGNITLKIDHLGNTGMYGSYFIHDGAYTFTALDIISKRFNVKEGSSIIWKGDPLNAILDIEAIYSLEASVIDLIPEEYHEDAYRQKVPVEAKLKLTESLFAPKIKLDFDLMSSNSISGSQLNIVDEQIRIIKNNEEELNKQVISLLVINSFLPVSTGVSGGTNMSGINTNVSSLISSQVSQWLSQVSNQFGSKYIEDIQIGVNYQAENKYYQRELDLLLSTSFLDDRVKVSGSYDVENINANFRVDYQVKKDSK